VGGTGVSAVRSCQKISLCPTEPMTAGCRMDPSLAKTKPFSDGGSISVITYLRRKKKPCITAFYSRREE